MVTSESAAGPAETAGKPLRSALMTVLVWTLLMAIPAAMIGGGAFLLYQRAVGTHVQATVVDCGLSGGIVGGGSTYSEDCTATWTLDGQVVIGPFSGGNGESDVGKTVDATVRGGTAYSRSLALPIILLLLGLPFLALPVVSIRSRARRSRTT